MIWFVTPAWRRYDLTRVVMEQRRHIVDELAATGVDVRQVVIADDDNLDIAAGFGFDTLRRPNYALGRRFNDGIQYAAQHGAEWIVPIGSDSFLDPAYLLPLPEPGLVMRTSHLYAIAEPGRLGQCKVMTPHGVGPYMIPRVALPSTLRPASDHRRKGVDGSTLRGLRRTHTDYVDRHPWQYVGFRSFPQMNDYDKLYRRIGVAQETDVAGRLAQFYPADLVDRALAACAAALESVA